MLEEPSHARFNVTQSYALCASVLCWVMQRIRTRLPEISTCADRAAAEMFQKWSITRPSETPWGAAISGVERIVTFGQTRLSLPKSERFEDHDVARFLKNLRDACAHGDGRTVVPFNRKSQLIGFTFNCEEKRRYWSGRVTLIESDFRAIGGWVARSYCDALRHDEAHRADSNFDRDAARIREAV